MTPYPLIALFILVIITAILAFFMGSRKKKGLPETDYYTLFTIGIVFAGAGTALLTTLGPAGGGMFIIGLVFMAVGLANKDKWKHKHTLPDNKKTVWIGLLIAGLILLAALSLFFMIR